MCVCVCVYARLPVNACVCVLKHLPIAGWNKERMALHWLRRASLPPQSKEGDLFRVQCWRITKERVQRAPGRTQRRRRGRATTRGKPRPLIPYPTRSVTIGV